MAERMSKAESAEILVAIARDPGINPVHRVHAVQTLASLNLLSEDRADSELYGDELSVRRSGRRSTPST
jgi:hypothetical protein